MRWKTFARTQFRRRAVVGGRALEADGRPFADGDSLSLRTVDAPWTRCHPCHMRRDGSFFFLDVPAGRYVLDRIDPEGNVAQSVDVSVPAVAPNARLPVATIELGIVRPAGRFDPEPVTTPPERN